MPRAEVEYIPVGARISVKDELSRSIEDRLEALMSSGESVELCLEVERDGSVSCQHAASSAKSLDYLIKTAERMLKLSYQADKYTPGEQVFLIATNLSTREQNAVPMTRARAEAVLAESLRQPSLYAYTVHSVDYVASDAGQVFFPAYSNPEQLARWNYEEAVVLLPQKSSSRREANQVMEEITALKYNNFLTIDGTSADVVSDSFVEKIASELSSYIADVRMFSGVRLRGLSGKHCRLFAHSFRHYKEGFIVW